MLSEDGRNRLRCRQMMYCGPVKANNQKCSVVDIAIQAWMLVSSLNILNDHIWKTLTTFLNYVCIKRNLNHLYHSRKAFFKKFSLLLFLFKLFLAIFCNSFSFLPLLLQFRQFYCSLFSICTTFFVHTPVVHLPLARLSLHFVKLTVPALSFHFFLFIIISLFSHAFLHYEAIHLTQIIISLSNQKY